MSRMKKFAALIKFSHESSRGYDHYEIFDYDIVAQNLESATNKASLIKCIGRQFDSIVEIKEV